MTVQTVMGEVRYWLGWRDAPGGILLCESFQKQLKFCLCCRSAHLGVTCSKGSASTLLVPKGSWIVWNPVQVPHSVFPVAWQGVGTEEQQHWADVALPALHYLPSVSNQRWWQEEGQRTPRDGQCAGRRQNCGQPSCSTWRHGIVFPALPML